MRRTGAIAILAALVALMSPAFAAASERQPQVRTASGIVAGKAERGTQVFRGIPYAAPPVGNLRWRPPHPAKPWRGARDASRAGAACSQDTARSEFWAQVGAQSEDCLFLNVWRPKARGTYPVMVFVHGGAFTFGAGDLPVYDGANLARRGAVIVTFNYRLGMLGFFAHPALTREAPGAPLGNYGIMDQIAALRWVRDNIAGFGGDPGNVTLFGESAGAGSVHVLMSSPGAAGLFHKAIMQSGAGGAAIEAIRGGANSAEAAGTRWAEGLGFTNATPMQLRAVPVAQLLKAYGFPFADGKVVTRSPGDAFRLAQEMRIPLLIGSNTNEASLFGNNAELARPMIGEAYPRLLAAYRQRPGSSDASAALDLAEDAAFVLPSLSMAAIHAGNGGTAYAYLFSQVRTDQRAGSLGAPHAGELEYLFGNQAPGQVWDADDKRVSQLMSDYWVRFARTGDPNGGDAPRWSPVGSAPLAYQVIGTRTFAATLTPLEEEVRTLMLEDAIRHWLAATLP